MPLEKSRGFSLSCRVFNDQDKIVSILTMEKGIIKAIAPGAMKKGNRFGSMLELFTEADFFFYEKEGKELVTLSKGDLQKSYFETVSNPSNVFYFYFMDEVIERFLPLRFRSERVFSLVDSVLKSGEKGVDPSQLLLYFLIWILRIEGVMFGYRICYKCSKEFNGRIWILDNYNGVICNSCRTGEKLTIKESEIEFLKWSEKNPPKNLINWTKTGIIRRLLIILKDKMEFHGELSFNSSRYLKEFL